MISKALIENTNKDSTKSMMCSFNNVTCIDKTRFYGINSDDKGEYYTGRKSIHEKVFKHKSSLFIYWDE